MDLNLLYAEHQRSLMRAQACTTHRASHLAAARAAAVRIATYLRIEGAPAACGWQRAAV